MSLMVQFTEGLFSAYWYLLLISAIFRLVPTSASGIGTILARLTDPYLYIFRRFIPMLPIGQLTIDLPWIVGAAAFFAIETEIASTCSRLLASI